MAPNTESSRQAWTEKEKLVFFMIMIETCVNGSIPWADLPKPPGRTTIAVQRMFERTKDSLKDDIEAVKSGQPVKNNEGDATAKPKAKGARKKKGGDDENGSTSPKTKTPRKRKAAEAGKDNGESPTKRVVKKDEDENENAEKQIKLENGDDDGEMAQEEV